MKKFFVIVAIVMGVVSAANASAVREFSAAGGPKKADSFPFIVAQAGGPRKAAPTFAPGIVAGPPPFAITAAGPGKTVPTAGPGKVECPPSLR